MDDLDGGLSYKGFALYDQVRFQYFKRFEFALNEYQECLKSVINGKLPPLTINSFVSKICTLYIELSPKIQYVKDEKLKNALTNIERYIATGEFKPNIALTADQFPAIQKIDERELAALFVEFSHYLFYLRLFIEKNGITFYERTEFQLHENPIRALEED
jgi:hypothetical protein